MYKYKLSFNLNKYQQQGSKDIVDNYLNNKNIILDAVCGAGKTEMLLEVIKISLNEGKKVGFACPRKILTIELYERIIEYFACDNFGLVVGGIKENVTADLIFLTTHQLVKYPAYFDLLIIDEIDAYPFCDNIELEQAALQASKQFIFLSATVPLKYKKLVKLNKLIYINNFKRHHLQNMPEIDLLKCHDKLMFISLFKQIKQLSNLPIIIFVPTINIGKRLTMLLRLLFIKCCFVSSKNIKESILTSFKNNEFNILISTTVLERGITLKNLQAIVYQADHFVFNRDTLIQICGRVGRDYVITDGKIIFLYKKMTYSMKGCCKKISEYND